MTLAGFGPIPGLPTLGRMEEVGYLSIHFGILDTKFYSIKYKFLFITVKNTIVHEMLYLGSQVENFRFNDEVAENRNENELEEINKIKASFEKLKENISRKSLDNLAENITNDHSNVLVNSNSNATSFEQNSTSYVTVSNSFQMGLKNQNSNNNVSTEKVTKLSTWNDLMTDDEKENNLSY